MYWHTTTSASAGTLSTDVFVTVIPRFKGLIRFLNFVAPIAEDPIPASHAKTIFLMSSALTSAPERTSAACPLDSAFMSLVFFCASSRLLLPAILTIGEETKKDTVAAIRTPSAVITIELFGDIDINAMMEPGAEGPTRPAFVIL